MVKAVKRPNRQGQGLKRTKPVRTPEARERAVNRLTDGEIEERAYLHGLIDPSHPSRGPAGAGATGTFIATTVATTQYTLQASAANPVRFPTGQGDKGSLSGGTVTTDNQAAFLDTTSSVGLFIQPSRYNTWSPGGVAGYSTESDAIQGWFWPTTDRLDNPILSPAAPSGIDITAANVTNAVVCPLEPMAYLSPGLVTLGAAGGVVSPDRLLWECKRRCVGMVAEITVNQPALDAQGEVYAGNNQDFVQPDSRPLFERYDYGSEDIVDPRTSITVGQYTLTDLARFQHIVPTGAFTNGSRHVAHWLPVTDEALKYEENFLTQSGAKPGVYTYAPLNTVVGPANAKISPASMLANRAGLVFVLKGLNTTNSNPTFTLSIRCNWEVALRPSDSVAWNIGEARLAHRFLADWAEIGRYSPGGPPGRLISVAIRGSGKIASGRAVALTGGTHSTTKVPVRAGVGEMKTKEVVDAETVTGINRIITTAGNMVSNVAGAKKVFDDGKKTLAYFTRGDLTSLPAAVGNMVADSAKFIESFRG